MKGHYELRRTGLVGETGRGVVGGLGGGVGHVLGSRLKYCCAFPPPPICLASPLSNFRGL